LAPFCLAGPTCTANYFEALGSSGIEIESHTLFEPPIEAAEATETNELTIDFTSHSDSLCSSAVGASLPFAIGEQEGKQDLLGACETFCGSENVPFLLGTERFGMTLSDMTSFAVGKATKASNTDLTQYKRCRAIEDSLDGMEGATSAFLAKFRIMEGSVIVLMGDLWDTMDEQQTRMQTPEFIDEVNKANDKATFIGQQYEQVLRRSKSGLHSLDSDITSLTQSANYMFTKFQENIADFKEYIRDCNGWYPRTVNKNFMQHLCTQTGSECGKHSVGCVCALNPLALSGTTRRRTTSVPATVAEDEALAAAAREAARRTTNVPATVAEVASAVPAKEPQASDEIESESLRGRGLAVSGCPQNDATILGDKDPTFNISDASENHITDNRIEFGPYHGELCDGRTGSMKEAKQVFDTKRIFAECDAFCNPGGSVGSMPLIIGTDNFGLDLHQANRVCLNPDFGMDITEGTDAKCANAKNSMKEVEILITGFLAKLRVLIASRQVFRSKIADGIDKVKTALQDEDTILALDQAAGWERVNKLWEVYEAALGLAWGDGGQATQLQSDADELSGVAQNLETALSVKIENIRILFNECNTFIPKPTGSYLLTMCNTNGNECLQDTKWPIGVPATVGTAGDFMSPGCEAEGRCMSHAMCCCGFNPLASASLEDFTDISAQADAIAAANSDASTGRQLSHTSACKKAEADSDDAVKTYQANTRKQFVDEAEINAVCDQADTQSSGQLDEYYLKVTNNRAKGMFDQLLNKYKKTTDTIIKEIEEIDPEVAEDIGYGAIGFFILMILFCGCIYGGFKAHMDTPCGYNTAAPFESILSAMETMKEKAEPVVSAVKEQASAVKEKAAIKAAQVADALNGADSGA
jgi:hypothetical protein